MVEYDFPKYQITLDIDEDIYFPAEDTFSLIDIIHLEDKHSFIVEIGGGSGIISIVLAKRNPKVRFLITDISLKAVKTIEKNIELNEIENHIDLVCMDKLEAGKHLLPDIIVWNPPYLPVDEEVSNLEALNKIMLIGGNKGFEEAYKLIKQLQHLGCQTVLYTIFSSIGSPESTFKEMKEDGIKIEICDEISLFFEKLYMVRVIVGGTDE
jgi:HemK-related putative methylase